MVHGYRKNESAGLQDASTFENVARKHQIMLLRVARNYLANPEDAADAVQEALILGYLHRGQLREAERIGSWLRQITIHTCRRIGRALKLTLPLERIERTGYDPVETLEQRLLLEKALACLTPATCLTLQLYYQDGLSLQEIATIQGVPVPPKRQTC